MVEFKCLSLLDMRLIKRSSSNVRSSIRKNGASRLRGTLMNTGHFYYIEDQYFLDFQDSQLMKHKETVDGILHNRPCFYAFEDSRSC